MRLRVIDRILIALSGLILLALAAAAALNVTGLVALPVAQAREWLTNRGLWWLLVIAACALLALLGVYEISVLFRCGSGKRGFITQKAENGEIAISVKTIESLVIKCAEKHGEISVQAVDVEETRGGLLIKLKASLPSGMNIPLAMGTLQKQIRQYITACSGVDVSEVRVKVDSTDKAMGDSVYAVSDGGAALPVEQPEPAPVPAEAVTPVEVPDERPEAPADERERLTHQRLFSTVEEPAMVPEPPTEEPVVSDEEIQAEIDSYLADGDKDIEAEIKRMMNGLDEEIPSEADALAEEESEVSGEDEEPTEE